MSIGYHVLKHSSPSIIIEHFKVSSQGVTESQGLISKWTYPSSNNSGFDRVFMDSDLQNIWASKGINLYCLRAGGLDQEVNDLQMGTDFNYDHLHIFVRGLGVGESICVIIPKSCYDGVEMRTIQFDNSGYHIQPSSLKDEIEPFFDDSEGFKINQLPIKSSYSCNNQHPNAPHLPYYYYNDQYLIWDFAHGLRRINAEIKYEHNNNFLSATDEYKRIMEERIQLPGNNEIIPKYGDYYRFSNDACSFGLGVKGITPIDNETPQPRYPKPMAQKNLEKKIQDDISYIQGFLSEKYPDFRNN